MLEAEVGSYGDGNKYGKLKTVHVSGYWRGGNWVRSHFRSTPITVRIRHKMMLEAFNMASKVVEYTSQHHGLPPVFFKGQEDYVQEVMLLVLEKKLIEKFNIGRTKFSTYVWTMTRNYLIRSCKKVAGHMRKMNLVLACMPQYDRPILHVI